MLFPPAPPLPPELLESSTPPEAYKLAAGEIVYSLVKSIPKAIQAKIPSLTLSPKREYSTIGSLEAASSARIVSSSFNVNACVLVEYGELSSTAVIRSWSKNNWPTWETYPPPYVPFGYVVPLK